MHWRWTWRKRGLVLGLVLMALGASAFTDPTLPVPPGVQAESSRTHYQRIIQSDQRTVAHVRNMRHQTPSHGSPGSPRTLDHRTSLPKWLAVALIGLVIVLITGMILTAKRRRQKQENTINRRSFR